MADKEGSSSEKGNNDQNGQISDLERDLAQSALAEFNKGNYAASLQYNCRLESLRPNDIKVLHNKVVAEYYKSELKKTDAFRKNLNSVGQQAHVNLDDASTLEDVEHCVLFYNQAVVLYHLNQHHAALEIMNKVFTFIEPMEEGLAHRVCLLLIELHFSTQQPELALSLLGYIENQFVSTDNAMKIIGDKELKTLEKEDQEKEIKPVTLDAATDAFRLKLMIYKARCFLFSCTFKSCKRQLKTILTPTNTSLAPVFIKAHLEFLRGNFQKSIKVLNTIPINNSIAVFKETGESPAVLYYNNMGCLHHYMGKPSLSVFYLEKALRENEAALAVFPKPEQGEMVSNRPLFCMGSNNAATLMYNMGVALLYGGRPASAFDCLVEAVQVYHVNPRLWLRLAECCIMVQKKNNSESFDVNSRRKDLTQGVIGTGAHKKIILNQKFWHDSNYCSEPQSYAIPVASLEFASLCLSNALLLLKDSGIKVPAPPSLHVELRYVSPLRACVLAASAYVSLCLGDPVIALEHAKALLKQPLLSGAHKLLGRLYCGEAYILLDKVNLATEILNPDIMLDDINDINTHTQCQWYPQNTNTARAALQYNMAVALSLRGEFDKAGDLLRQVWKSKGPSCDAPMHVIALALYIELILGHTDVARNIVKQNCPQLQR